MYEAPDIVFVADRVTLLGFRPLGIGCIALDEALAIPDEGERREFLRERIASCGFPNEGEDERQCRQHDVRKDKGASRGVRVRPAFSCSIMWRGVPGHAGSPKPLHSLYGVVEPCGQRLTA